MALPPNNSKHLRAQRNIVFFGETGTGKSSAINLLLGTGTLARVSNDSQPCTQANTSYNISLNGTTYVLWDTRGLGQGRSFLRAILSGSPEKELKKFLKERHYKHEIDLLVYCVRGSRATNASVKYYENFCAITRRLAAPVAIVVTQLEREEDMEDWWNRNSSRLEELKMEFDDHACITTRLWHDRLAESRRRLVDLITRNHHWEAKESGYYFGSPVQKFTPSVPLRRPPTIFERVWGKVGGGVSSHPPGGHPSPSSRVSSIRDSSFYTAPSPQDTIPPSLVVVPSTPRSATTSVKVPNINTDSLGVGDPPQSSSEETSSTGSSLHSTPYTSAPSGCTSHSEVHLQSFTEENEGCLNGLPFKHSNTIVRRRNGYPTRSGGFGDVWECDLISEEPSRRVAVKAVKTGTSYGDLTSHEKKLHRELRIWGRLRHRNVVPLLGVVPGFGPLLSMVSPWFSNGSLSRYLVDRQAMKLTEKHSLLGDIAAGLRYLHSQDVIHGDLHSDNVLINEHGTACLTDFGLSLVIDFVGTSYLKSSICGALQFADPALVERVDSSQGNVVYPTMPCDIYSFGGLILHVLSGKKPYDGMNSTFIFKTVLKGERPQIPSHEHITPWHKSVIRTCWDHDERNRTSADHLLRKFNP